MKKNIFLALDFNSLNKALEVTEKTKDYLAGIKIGLELYSAIGLAGIKEFDKFKLPIFLDTKIFDIPNQVAKTIKVISEIKSIQYFNHRVSRSVKFLYLAIDCPTMQCASQRPERSTIYYRSHDTKYHHQDSS